MEMYILFNTVTGQFAAHKRKIHFLGDDINDARLFKRKSDAIQAIKRYPGDASHYELVPLKLCVPFEVYEVSNKINTSKDIVNSRVAALTRIAELKRQNGLHRDYFDLKKLDRVRPSWQDYFLGLAVAISKRSHDIHTQHGCVIVDDDTHHILGTGYNGFPRGMKDQTLPTNRIDKDNPDGPNKYEWMVHAEANAVHNMVKSATETTTAYVTGEPCTPCLITLWQTGIGRVVHREAYGGTMVDEKMRRNRAKLLRDTGMRVTSVKADLTWLSSLVSP
jgi:dCMP deaminase